MEGRWQDSAEVPLQKSGEAQPRGFSQPIFTIHKLLLNASDFGQPSLYNTTFLDIFVLPIPFTVYSEWYSNGSPQKLLNKLPDRESATQLRHQPSKASSFSLSSSYSSSSSLNTLTKNFSTSSFDRDLVIMIAMIAFTLVVSLVLIAAILFLRCRQSGSSSGNRNLCRPGCNEQDTGCLSFFDTFQSCFGACCHPYFFRSNARAIMSACPTICRRNRCDGISSEDWLSSRVRDSPDYKINLRQIWGVDDENSANVGLFRPVNDIKHCIGQYQLASMESGLPKSLGSDGMKLFFLNYFGHKML
ncbi:unnamed protein product [Protopolystoma xenopodis]|uniref:Uncharacterized protein n=1 Tax=Protopolystoma xenopodis TaxID=117903 RepID=A0A448X4H5_9PLAT|nr:unnamed protein product [Protopolystoma xenopodis]